MTTFRNIYLVAVQSVIITGILFGFATSVSAQSNIEVTFAAEPLFLDADVKPGDSTTRTVTITNNGPTAEDVYASVQNTFDSGGLSEVMQLSITRNGTEYFNGTFADFFASTPVLLQTLANGNTAIYDFTASLDSSVGNEYQKTQFGFDMVIGFVGGESVTDGPVGGGGGGVSPDLRIANEAVETLADSATITWTTNLSATSYVVCGLVADGPFTIQTIPPFGYQFVIPESTTLTRTHGMTQTGLAPGEYECRPASRERLTDAFTVGLPIQFVIPEGIVAGETISAVPPTEPIGYTTYTPTGSVLGVGKKGDMGGLTYDEWRAQVDAERQEREELEALRITTSTTTGTSARADREQDERNFWSALPTEQLPFLWGALLVILLGILWWWRRQSTV